MLLPFVQVLSANEIPSMVCDHMRRVYDGCLNSTLIVKATNFLIDAYFSKFKVAVISLFKEDNVSQLNL